MLEEIVARQPPSAGSRPVPIGSRSIGVSLQPAIPRRVAPQQSPLPLHRSPTMVAQSRSGEAIKWAAQPHCEDAVQASVTCLGEATMRVKFWMSFASRETNPSASAAPVRWARSSRDGVSRWSCPPPPGVSFLLCAPGAISILRRQSPDGVPANSDFPNLNSGRR